MGRRGSKGRRGRRSRREGGIGDEKELSWPIRQARTGIVLYFFLCVFICSLLFNFYLYLILFRLVK